MVALRAERLPFRKPERPQGWRGALYALPDIEDDHDQSVVPRGPVPNEVPLAAYTALGLPVMNQGDEHACTGFGLAAVVHYLLHRRAPFRTHLPVSPRMLYEMAKRYDDLDGEAYKGSTARAALKGWHKHGVCALHFWPYVAGDVDRDLTATRQKDAWKRPLLRYQRVDEADLAMVRAAIAEVGIVYVTAEVHDGWRNVGPDGRIPWSPQETGNHAFALVAYDAEGFWLHNSKGTAWGRNGFGYLSNVDWGRNSLDAWVACLGDPTDER
jgi:hypothetical protein